MMLRKSREIVIFGKRGNGRKINYDKSKGIHLQRAYSDTISYANEECETL